jgi:hypothetical protein
VEKIVSAVMDSTSALDIAVALEYATMMDSASAMMHRLMIYCLMLLINCLLLLIDYWNILRVNIRITIAKDGMTRWAGNLILLLTLFGVI